MQCLVHKLFTFISELMGLLLAGMSQSQANQPNNLAEASSEGMLFTKQSNPQAIAEHACAPFLA
eukprot:scaffold304103_cov17-Tisochrysis_lutea.AAC.1